MAETIFIRTVAFGGYDRTDVEKRLEYLQTQLYEARNELREYKLIAEEQKKGADPEKAEETVIASERAKLTMVQVQNESLTQKLKEAKDENKTANKQISDLKQELAELKEKMEKDAAELANYRSGKDPTALSRVFIEAQRSADMLVEDAKKQSEQLENNTKALVEDMVTSANDSASKIIYEAEKNAAEINARALNDSEQMSVASENLRAVMLEDVKSIGSEISKVKDLLESIEKTAIGKISKSADLLYSTEKKLCSGGVPVFKIPETIEPKYPEPPKNTKESGEKIEKLREIASTLDGVSAADAKDKKEKKAAAKEQSDENELDKLLAMANSLDDDLS